MDVLVQTRALEYGHERDLSWVTLGHCRQIQSSGMVEGYTKVCCLTTQFYSYLFLQIAKTISFKIRKYIFSNIVGDSYIHRWKWVLLMCGGDS